VLAAEQNANRDQRDRVFSLLARSRRSCHKCQCPLSSVDVENLSVYIGHLFTHLARLGAILLLFLVSQMKPISLAKMSRFSHFR